MPKSVSQTSESLYSLSDQNLNKMSLPWRTEETDVI